MNKGFIIFIVISIAILTTVSLVAIEGTNAANQRKAVIDAHLLQSNLSHYNCTALQANIIQENNAVIINAGYGNVDEQDLNESINNTEIMKLKGCEQ